MARLLDADREAAAESLADVHEDEQRMLANDHADMWGDAPRTNTQRAHDEWVWALDNEVEKAQ